MTTHKGHRERLKERMFSEGLRGFAPHEVLELLLCFAIPQRDVNPLAHALLDTFGSLSAVLEADAEALMACPGMGRNATALLTMLPQLVGYYTRDRLQERPMLGNAGQAGRYCTTLFYGMANEAVYLICLDAQNRVIHPALLQNGTVDQSPVYPRDVVETALRHRAHAVVLTHNHPGGSLQPSAADYEVTRMVMAALEVVDVRVIDHIIVSREGFLSMAQQSAGRRDALAQAQEPAYHVGSTARPLAHATPVPGLGGYEEDEAQ